MNERIKELASQAKIDVDARWATQEKAVYPEAHYRYSAELNERLVELVVAEFNTIADEMLATYHARQLDSDDFGEKNFWASGASVCTVLRDKFSKKLGLENE